MKKSLVALIPCTSYDPQEVDTALRQGLSLLGGIEAFVKPGEKLLIKPNLLRKALPEKAIITDPAVIKGFASILHDAGFTDLHLADSGSGLASTHELISGTDLAQTLPSLGVNILDYTEGIHTPYPAGSHAKEFILPKELTEMDAVISLCKMKTHALERITGAVKNSYGFIYGLNKTIGHTKYPNADTFARMLVDLNKCVAPRLYIMDGVIAMEGNGPSSGDPIPMNVILMSTDPVALDSVFARLVYLNPRIVPTCLHGEQMGLGFWHKQAIRVLTPEGEITMEEAVDRCGNKNFRVDRKPEHKKPGLLNTIVPNLFAKRPYIRQDLCIRCGICVKSCPVEGKAVSFKTQGKPPVYDYNKCIRCFCCQEMCPQKAIQVRR